MPKKDHEKFTIEGSGREYISLKEEKSRIERRLEILKEGLEPLLEEAPGKSVELAGWKMTLLHTSRESFSLSKAKEKIDGRTLAPFVSVSEFSQIRLYYQGGEESEAA